MGNMKYSVPYLYIEMGQYGMIIVLICIVILYITYAKYKYFSNYIDGYYTGDPEFLDSADLGEFCLFLNNGRGYIIMSNENEDVIENVAIEYKRSIQWASIYKTPPVFNMDFENEMIIPKKLKLKIYPETGHLILFDNEKVYAILIKDNYNTKLLL